MYSSKTDTLISLARRYRIADKKVLVIKFTLDNRYSTSDVASHGGSRIPADHITKTLGDIDVTNYDVICIDEIQFYPDNYRMADWADQGKIIIGSGLSGNYLRQPFKGIPELIAKADQVTLLNAVCVRCKSEKGAFSALRKEKEEHKSEAINIFIGGTESYVALCRQCYLKNNNEA